uniref:Transmembrane protein 54 n=1 Tax=Latimeria chalumnae TaxID=7897 RepID=H3B4K6_LATCH
VSESLDGGWESSKLFMKTGLALIVVGHINFILGAIVHGSILRHLSQPKHGVATEYFSSNILAAASGILSICCGISAIVLSRNLNRKSLRWTLLVMSVASTLLSTACVLSLIAVIIMTVSNKGHTLLAACNFTTAEVRFAHKCPFDPTRIYDTALTLWIPSAFLAVVESVFTVRCFLFSVSLLNLQVLKKKHPRKRVSLARVQ